jgi:hypothetical protein
MIQANKTLQRQTYKCSLEITFKTSFSDTFRLGLWWQDTDTRAAVTPSGMLALAVGLWALSLALPRDRCTSWTSLLSFELLILPSIQTLRMLSALWSYTELSMVWAFLVRTMTLNTSIAIWKASKLTLPFPPYLPPPLPPPRMCMCPHACMTSFSYARMINMHMCVWRLEVPRELGPHYLWDDLLLGTHWFDSCPNDCLAPTSRELGLWVRPSMHGFLKQGFWTLNLGPNTFP